MQTNRIIAFELRGKFASFADPLGISNTFSFPIPTKTAVAGIVGAIVGIDDVKSYEQIYNFEYSIVALNPIQKQTFSVNFIADYTSKTKSKFDKLKKGDLIVESPDFIEPKPTNKELLINPRYLVFVKDSFYTDILKNNLQSRTPKYPIYLGNSEFAGNFGYIETLSVIAKNESSVEVDSIFPRELEIEKFAENSIYTTVRMATKVELGSFDNNRKYTDYKTVVFSSGATILKECEYFQVELINQKKYNLVFV